MLPSWAAAQVIQPRVIHVRVGTPITRRLIAHELTHVMQWEEHGWMFAFLYVAELAREGYWENKFEIAAYANEKNDVYLGWADELIARLP